MPQATGKPEKPREDFPLFPHANGQWAKKILGKIHFFGVWADPAAALDKYLDRRDALMAGRQPRPADEHEPTMRDLGNAFLIAKRALVDSGELALRTWRDYARRAGRVSNIGAIIGAPTIAFSIRRQCRRVKPSR